MKSIREIYQIYGIESLYTSGNYSNPHLDKVNKLLIDFKTSNSIIDKNILDLCCGHGEVSLLFKDNNVTGVDPYTYEFYKTNTNNDCKKYSFDDIAFKDIDLGIYDYIICSYALHLCAPNALELLLYKLAVSSYDLIIISPSDAIQSKIDGIMGWTLINHSKYNRTHLFHFKNNIGDLLIEETECEIQK